MSKWSPYLFFLILISVFSMFGCGGLASAPTPSPANSYQVVTVSDLHFNPLYDPHLYSQLSTSPYTAWDAIFEGSTVSTPSAAGTDTNYLLLLLTLKSMQQNMGNSPVILFTGDLLGHNIPSNYCTMYLTSINSPVNSTTLASCATSEASEIQQFINGTFEFVASEIHTYVGTVPVIYVPGNIDTYQGGLGPNTQFLTSIAPTVYSQFLNSSPNEQAFMSTFGTNGYYAVEPLGSKLLVIGLNSNSFIAGLPSYAAATAEISWLDSQLSSAKAAGQKVWILMHVPPGAYSQSIAQVAATPGDVDESDAAMMWDAGTQSLFVQTMAKYRGVVTLMLAGHTHMDEFRVLPTGDVLEQLPGISPCFGNNPAYKILTIMQNTFTPTDYQSFDHDLSALPPPSQFSSLYQFSTTYGVQGNLATSLGRLYPQFASNQDKRDTYTLLFGSGNTSVNPVTLAPWNPINDVNWPIFACTISQIDQPQYVGCVTTY